MMRYVFGLLLYLTLNKKYSENEQYAIHINVSYLLWTNIFVGPETLETLAHIFTKTGLSGITFHKKDYLH